MKNDVIFFWGLLACATAAKVDYTGHKVIRAFPQTEEQLQSLRDWQSTGSIDFWVLSRHFIDIHVTPQSFDHISKTLVGMKINHHIQIEDLGQLEKAEEQSIALRRALYSGKAIDLENYHTYDEVMAYLADLASTNPLVTTNVGGTTLEGRDIVQITISSDLSANKPVNFFDCNMHAREWITAATCVWIIDQLTTGYGVDDEITSFVDKYDWKIVPITNPDGYEYNWSDDRLWRKNRNPNPGAECIGVDGNRNFPVGFADPSGSSNQSCATIYQGESAFSERESAALRDLIVPDKGRVNVAISMHSWGQQFLSPNGYTTNLPSEYPEMERVMEAAAKALTNTYGTPYEYGSFANILYIGAGVSTDYYYQNEGIVHSYTIELRDNGTLSFILPADQIVPTATETWNGIKALINAIN